MCSSASVLFCTICHFYLPFEAIPCLFNLLFAHESPQQTQSTRTVSPQLPDGHHSCHCHVPTICPAPSVVLFTSITIFGSSIRVFVPSLCDVLSRVLRPPQISILLLGPMQPSVHHHKPSMMAMLCERLLSAQADTTRPGKKPATLLASWCRCTNAQPHNAQSRPEKPFFHLSRCASCILPFFCPTPTICEALGTM